MNESDKMKKRIDENIEQMEQDQMKMILNDLQEDILDQEKLIHNIKMFQSLANHCDERIVCKIYRNKQTYAETSILRQVMPFGNIEVMISECASCGYPFVGVQTGIMSISLESTKEELYSNPNIENFDYNANYKNQREQILELEKTSYGINPSAKIKVIEKLKQFK